MHVMYHHNLQVSIIDVMEALIELNSYGHFHDARSTEFLGASRGDAG